MYIKKRCFNFVTVKEASKDVTYTGVIIVGIGITGKSIQPTRL